MNSDRLERLRKLRDQLTERLETCKSDHAFSMLTAQLRDTLLQIEELEKAQPSEEATPLDEIRAKREARRQPARKARTPRAKS